MIEKTFAANGTHKILLRRDRRYTAVIEGDFGGGTVSLNHGSDLDIAYEEADALTAGKGFWILTTEGEVALVIAGATDPSVTIKLSPLPFNLA